MPKKRNKKYLLRHLFFIAKQLLSSFLFRLPNNCSRLIDIKHSVHLRTSSSHTLYVLHEQNNRSNTNKPPSNKKTLMTLNPMKTFIMRSNSSALLKMVLDWRQGPYNQPIDHKTSQSTILHLSTLSLATFCGHLKNIGYHQLSRKWTIIKQGLKYRSVPVGTGRYVRGSLLDPLCRNTQRVSVSFETAQYPKGTAT